MNKTLVIEGWRFSPHSYAVVNQFQILELLKRGDIQIYHRDAPLFRPDWPRVSGLFDEEDEQAIAGVIAPPAGAKPQAAMRISYPYDFSPTDAQRLFVFITAEMGFVPDEAVAGNVPLARALNGAPDAKIVTTSEWSRAGILQSGADDDAVFVVPAGIDPKLFHASEEPQRGALRERYGWKGFVFVYVGAMTTNKGIPYLLRGFAAVAQKHPYVTLVLKGADALYDSRRLVDEAMKKLTEHERGLIAPRLRYRGEAVSFAQMARVYQAADAYVSPYLAEGFNMPVLEAAACGLPVICTSGGPTDEFTTEDFAMRVASRVHVGTPTYPRAKVLLPDLSDLISKMNEVVENSAWRENARLAGPVFTHANFTWAKAVDRLMEVIFPPS